MCLWVETDDFTHLRYGWRTARKEHACIECHRTIGAGERYFYDDQIDHDAQMIRSFKMCNHCRTLITVAAKAAGCPEAWWYTEVLSTHEDMSFMHDIVYEHIHPPGVQFRLLRYWVMARRQWADRRGQLLPLPLEVGGGP